MRTSLEEVRSRMRGQNFCWLIRRKMKREAVSQVLKSVIKEEGTRRMVNVETERKRGKSRQAAGTSKEQRFREEKEGGQSCRSSDKEPG